MSALVRKTLNILIVLLAFSASLKSYNQMPDVMASHWDANDNVNGTMPKDLGLFLIPSIMCAFAVFLLIAPKIKAIYSQLEIVWDRTLNFSIVLQTFLFGIHLHMILYNLGYVMSTSKVVGFLLGLLFLSVSPLLKDLPRNYFMGFKLPWTLKDERVWKITHDKAATHYKVVGIFLMIAPFVSNTAVWASIGLLFGSSIYLVIDSWLVSRRI